MKIHKNFTIKSKLMYNALFILSFLILFFMSFILNTTAQVQESDISLNTYPTNPAPGEDVNAVLKSYTVDLSKALISWSIDDIEIINGIGKTDFIFKMKDISTPIELSVSISTIDGKNITKNISLITSNVDMLWEATDSYVPPFYRGKALVAPEGSFKVVAIPNINTIDGRVNPNNMTYTWEQDGNGRPSQSGWGKNSLTFQNSYLEKENEIRVKISDISGSIKTEGNINLRTSNPKIVFYKKDPVQGILKEKAINNNYYINKEGETIVAIPYFFSPKNIDNSVLSFEWFLSGKKIKTPNIKNEINLRPESGKTGSSRIRVFINNTKTLFQELEKEIIVNF